MKVSDVFRTDDKLFYFEKTQHLVHFIIFKVWDPFHFASLKHNSNYTVAEWMQLRNAYLSKVLRENITLSFCRRLNGYVICYRNTCKCCGFPREAKKSILVNILMTNEGVTPSLAPVPAVPRPLPSPFLFQSFSVHIFFLFFSHLPPPHFFYSFNTVLAYLEQQIPPDYSKQQAINIFLNLALLSIWFGGITRLQCAPKSMQSKDETDP